VSGINGVGFNARGYPQVIDGQWYELTVDIIDFDMNGGTDDALFVTVSVLKGPAVYVGDSPGTYTVRFQSLNTQYFELSLQTTAGAPTIGANVVIDNVILKDMGTGINLSDGTNTLSLPAPEGDHDIEFEYDSKRRRMALYVDDLIVDGKYDGSFGEGEMVVGNTLSGLEREAVIGENLTLRNGGRDCKSSFCQEITFDPPMRGDGTSVNLNNPKVLMRMADDMQANWSASSDNILNMQFACVEVFEEC
jgi:hypothetical protein